MNNLTTNQQNDTKESLSEKDRLLQARKEAMGKAKSELSLPDIKWLTENSRKFLESGYLTGDTTPEERILEIAQHAETILGIEGYAEKFYKYMSEGFYSLASPVWSNFGKNVVYQLVALDLVLLTIWEIFYSHNLK